MTIEPKRRRPAAKSVRANLKEQLRPSRRKQEKGPEPAPEAAAPQPRIAKAPVGKLGALVELMARDGGVTMEELVTATGWQAHSIRGAMAGALKRNRGYEITSAKADGVRRYRITGRKGDD